MLFSELKVWSKEGRNVSIAGWEDDICSESKLSGQEGGSR